MVVGSIAERERAERDQHAADLVFHALADATRRDIVSVVLRTERSVSALARTYPMSFAAVQKHVAILERAGLVRKRPSGREQLVSGNPDAMHTAHRLLDQLEQLWRQRVDRINEILADDPDHPDHPDADADAGVGDVNTGATP